jgi:hypothetical protein
MKRSKTPDGFWALFLSFASKPESSIWSADWDHSRLHCHWRIRVHFPVVTAGCFIHSAR